MAIGEQGGAKPPIIFQFLHREIQRADRAAFDATDRLKAIDAERARILQELDHHLALRDALIELDKLAGGGAGAINVDARGAPLDPLKEKLKDFGDLVSELKKRGLL